MDKTYYKFSLKGANADLDACALFLLPESRTGGKRNIGCSVQYFGFYICKKDWLNFFIYKNLKHNNNEKQINRITGIFGIVLFNIVVIRVSYPTIRVNTRITKRFSNLIFNIIPFYS